MRDSVLSPAATKWPPNLICILSLRCSASPNISTCCPLNTWQALFATIIRPMSQSPVQLSDEMRRRHSNLVSSTMLLHNPHLVNGVLPNGTYPATKSAIHTDYVQRSITSHGDHRLLNAPAPAVHRSESRLPRIHRSTLSQLRSGHCVKLQSYLHRVDKADIPTCPHCKASDETVPHIFECLSFPTVLSLNDLWSRPTRVAAFLSSHLSFSLPSLDPPRDRPPPEPPP